MTTRILILPGWQNSGPEHWQTRWEQQDGNCQRVLQKDWAKPKRQDWIESIDHAISQATGPVVLVAHSLGCVSVAHWQHVYAHNAAKVKGALLVAPADVDRDDAPRPIKDFAPVPKMALPFPSVVVASRNDPYLAMERAHEFAGAWASRLVDIGFAGHINSESNLGDWPEGKRLLAELIAGE
ncbi:MAG TPA: alpha/beta hydrolase [Candidatus Angelobacter sp.]|nr:alpha/beta hydrolase [Candidatus Angelobacter sp.]